MIKLLLVEDELAVRKGLRMRLAAEPDVTIVGEAADGKAALMLVRKLHPDVVLMDIAMPRLDGIAATEALQSFSPRPAVIILTVHDDADTRARAKAAGAVAFITKCGVNDDLLMAVRQAVQGGQYRPDQTMTPSSSEENK